LKQNKKRKLFNTEKGFGSYATAVYDVLEPGKVTMGFTFLVCFLSTAAVEIEK
jgi:hypothetical protein